MESLEQNPNVLAFDVFTHVDAETGTPRYNNFFAQFLEGEFFMRIYRETPYFERLATEHPGLVVELSRKVQEASLQKEKMSALKLLEPEMYEAYKFMRSYGATDAELFG